MNEPIVLTPYGVLTGLLILTGLVALIFLIICLIKLYTILCNINKIIDNNDKAISKTIQNLPVLTETATDAFENVKEFTESANDVFLNLSGAVASEVSEDGIISIISDITSIVTKIVQVISGFFKKR